MKKYYKTIPVKVWHYKYDENGGCATPDWVLNLINGKDIIFNSEGTLLLYDEIVPIGDYLVMDENNIVKHYTPEVFKNTFFVYI